MSACLAASAILMTGARRGWVPLHPPLDWILPVGLMAVGIVVWARGLGGDSRS
ncbi:MAG TPA: hypothetical protein VI504_01700 [Candidatus Eisenbacteria bacterium]